MYSFFIITNNIIGDIMHKSIEIIKEKLGNSTDIVTRNIENISYIYLESVSSDDKISNFLNKSLLNIKTFNDLLSLINKNIYNSHIIVEQDINKVYYYLASGFTCIFINNEKNYIAIETRASIDRGVNESSSEPIIRGPKDSFTENHSINVGLIRKRIKDKNLRIEEILVGVRTQAKTNIIYIKDIADKKRVKIIKEIINNINIDGILDTGYITDYIERNNKSLFPIVISTERPDLVCQNILNGKIVILVENSPTAIILPACLEDFMKVSEDYFHKSSNTTFSRILRYIAFIIAILTPSLYIALMTFNQEIIPDQLLISLAGQRSQVPFPTFIEVLIYIIIFEILREADIRSKSNAGASMSIVGALILGDASVSAGLVSPIVIIVVAITSICELVFSDMDLVNAIRQWRLIFIFSTILTGMIGIVVTGLILIIKLCSIEVLDTPYLLPFSPLNKKSLKDSIMLVPSYKRKYRQEYITNNIVRNGD